MSEPTISAVETVLDNGKFGTRTVKFETGLLARQAAGSVTAYLDDDTMLLSATTAGKHPKDHFDFFPLTIDVEERMYAAGQIPGSFFRSEGRPGEDAILTCRLIDRPLRPTFKKGLRNEVQVVITVLALNPDAPYDVLAINAASMSTQLSGLPFSGPVGGVRVALIDGTWVAFPTHTQLEDAVFDMVVAGRVTETGDVAIMMVEAEATETTVELVRGGQQAPTTPIGEKTTSYPSGRDPKTSGYPLKMAELLALVAPDSFIARMSIHDVKHVRKTKQAIRQAFEIQLRGEGFGLVEILAACPTNWRMDARQCMEKIRKDIIPHFPLGVFSLRKV